MLGSQEACKPTKFPSLALLAAIALAGCTGAPSPGADVTGGSGSSADLADAPQADGSAPAPDWRVGDRWGFHVYFGSDDTQGYHYNAIVVDADGDYTLAPDDTQVAKEHALFDLPVLGTIARPDLAMQGFGGTWDVLEFPLDDGASWTGEIPNIAFDILPEGSVPLRFTAAANDRVATPDGTASGFTVTGVATTDDVVVEYDYVPALGWFARFVVYDIDPDQDPLEFTARVMDHGRNWTGTYYVDEATTLVDNYDVNGLDAPPPEGEPIFNVSPHVPFTVPAGATYLYGFVDWGAIFGGRSVVLVPPEGEARRYEAVGGTAEEDGFVWVDEPAVAGEWTLATAGGGGHTYAYVFLASIVETSRTLP